MAQPEAVADTALGRPSGWATVGPINRALASSIGQARQVYGGRGGRCESDLAQDGWMREQLFD
eukprot:2497908-Alexandrium_andersonii.AAC.1